MNISYVIPSYNRATTLKNKTLKMLNDNNIDPVNIYIILANKNDENHYKTIIGDEYNYMVGEQGVVEVRNFIRRAFNTRPIVMIDDDISAMMILTEIPNKKHKQFKKMFNLKQYVIQAFNHLYKTKGRLFGFNAANNPLGVKYDIREGLVFLGGIYCEICDCFIQIDPKYRTLDDKYICLEYYRRYGNIYRYNAISHNASRGSFVEQGGLQTIFKTTKNRITESLEQHKVLYENEKEYFSSGKECFSKSYKGQYFRLMLKRKYVKNVIIDSIISDNSI